MGITQSTPNNKSNDKIKEIIKQLEEWTEKRISDILFDSDKDSWNKNTSVFDQRIKNKEHIIIIIEDEEGNKFGGYVNSRINRIDGYIFCPHAFLFSLKSNGRMKGMMKFDIKYPQYAFYLWEQTDKFLFSIGCGHDINVYKENYKTRSYCKQKAFEYKRIINALCGKEYPNLFTPTRIIVIEMK